MKSLTSWEQAKGEANRATYRPYFANILTIRPKIVKLMAISNNVFGCYKLQFCTVSKANSEEQGANWM